MSNRAGITDIPSQDMKLESNKKTVLLGTNQSLTKLKILHWNAGGLSSAKVTDLKQITTQNNIDLLIVNEANTTAENVQYYNINDFTTHTLFKARQIASRMLVTVRNNLKSEFKIIKEMNDYDTAEIVKVLIWKENKKFTIYGIYSPPGNKNLCLDTRDITSATVVIGDFNAASPSWGYNYYNHAGRTIEEFLNSQKLELLYNPEDQKTFLHYSRSTTNPSLAMVSSDIYENSQKAVLEDLGSGQRAVLVTILLKVPTNKPNTHVTWNFRKANWIKFQDQMEIKSSTINTEEKCTQNA